MVNSDDDQVATPLKEEKLVAKKKKCGPTRMKDIIRFSSEGRRNVIQYNELGQPIEPNATKLRVLLERL